MKLYDQAGVELRLGTSLGSGGEGEVFAIAGQPLVAKIFIKDRRTKNKFEKLQAMVARQPEGADGLVDGFPVLTWPKSVVFTSASKREQSTFVGYTMAKIEMANFVPFFQVTTAHRRDKFGGVPVRWDKMVLLAARVCHVVRTLHAYGYAVGDLNDRNVLISRKFTPLLMDTDSFQVPRTFGRHFPSTVGDQLYWPPELLGIDLKDNKKSRIAGDNYALATLLFQLFMNGNRPYQARGTKVAGLETLMHKTQAGHFPWPNPKPGVLEPPANAPAWQSLPLSVRRAFTKCFVAGHTDPGKRPTSEQWYRLLRKEAKRGFQECAANERHVMCAKDKQCPWCLDPNDPFASRRPARPLRFKVAAKPAPKRRATK